MLLHTTVLEWARGLRGRTRPLNLPGQPPRMDEKRDYQMQMDVQRAFTRYELGDPHQRGLFLTELRAQLLDLLRNFFSQNPNFEYYQASQL